MSRPAGRRAGRFPMSLWVLAVPALVGGIRLVLTLGRPLVLAGDQAVLELAVRRALDGAQLLGPYSRFGFSQPGPAYFYAQAPFYGLSGGSPRALALGALVINLACAGTAVLVVRRFLGEAAARWAAAVLAVFLVLLSPAFVADPWNPYVVTLPLVLTLVLAAAAAAGSVACLAGALVAGSFVVQTHLGTGMAVAAAVATGAALLVLGRRRAFARVPAGQKGSLDRPRTGAVTLSALRHRPTWIGIPGALLVLGVMWLPPLVEQARGSAARPGNLTKVVRFFTQDHPAADRGVDHSLPTAAADVSAHLTVLPFGRHQDGRPVPGGRVAGAAATVAGGLAVAAAGWRLRRPFLAALGMTAVAGTAAAVWSATRIVGEVHPYLLVWTSALVVPIWVGAGLVGAEALRARVRRAGALPALLALASFLPPAALGWSLLRGPLTPLATATSVTDLTGLVRQWLAEQRAGRVQVRHAGEQWPLAAGLVVQLQKEGFHVSVADGWTPLYGDQLRPSGDEEAALWLGPGGAAPPPEVVGAERLGEAGETSVWVTRPVGVR